MKLLFLAFTLLGSSVSSFAEERARQPPLVSQDKAAQMILNGESPVQGTAQQRSESPKAKLTKREIKDVQRALSVMGFLVNQDGINGPQTVSAVKRFQALHNLTPTGEIDVITLEQLNADAQSVPSANSKASDAPDQL